MNQPCVLHLDTQGRVIEQFSPFRVFRLSWVAHLREVVAFLIRLFLCGVTATLVSLALDRYRHTHTEAWLPVLGWVVAMAWTAYSVMLTNAVRLFTDENGVWVQRGVFPWQQGVFGVQWRDLGQAGYTPGFLSWLLRSYDIHVSRRFTADAGLHICNVHRGDRAVEHINAVLAHLQGRVMP